MQITVPPLQQIISIPKDYIVNISLNFASYVNILQDSFYIRALLSSLKIAMFSSLGSLVIGYGLAYSISRMRVSLQPFLLLLIALPFWTSFLIRIYAWMAMLSTHGLINKILLSLGIIYQPLMMLDNDIAVCIGITYCYLPFVVFPIYAVLNKIPQDYLDAAANLGAKPVQVFLGITLPLSLQGILAGFLLVFVPAIGEVIIPEILGAPDTITIGRVIWWEFFNNRQWPTACAVAVLMAILFVGPVILMRKREIHALESNTEKGKV